MAEFSMDVYCPDCYTVITVKLRNVHPGGSNVCPKCGASVKFKQKDINGIMHEIEKIENTINWRE